MKHNFPRNLNATKGKRNLWFEIASESVCVSILYFFIRSYFQISFIVVNKDLSAQKFIVSIFMFHSYFGYLFHLHLLSLEN